GHLDGDKVLQCLASIILRCLRNSDSAFRYGGEEFVVLLPETTGKAAHSFAERLCLEFANEIVESATGLSICCTVSVGVAESFAGESENSFIRRADEACYEAKRCGKNRVCFAGAPI
ncbi:MAG: GGDEF domain-containing protein, partial [Azonexus sp.]|nr:GGDEF domain-containing protein [Azonexus sp.]